jgi:hypothetical protein
MAGALTISTLNNDTGVLATQNGMTGIAKAWVNFNGTGTVAIRDSFNVSSITDNGTGDYTVNFTTAMPNANYSTVVSGALAGTATLCQLNNDRTFTTSAAQVYSRQSNTGGQIDAPLMCVAVFSS